MKAATPATMPDHMRDEEMKLVRKNGLYSTDTASNTYNTHTHIPSQDTKYGQHQMPGQAKAK